MKDYDFVNPPHYKEQRIETIEKMIRIWGVEAVMMYCEITAFKYRDRLGKKPGEDVDRELSKIMWFEGKAKELNKKINESRN